MLKKPWTAEELLLIGSYMNEPVNMADPEDTCFITFDQYELIKVNHNYCKVMQDIECYYAGPLQECLDYIFGGRGTWKLTFIH